jgi:6-phosphogluconolactonase
MKIQHMIALLPAIALFTTAPVRAGQLLYLASHQDKTIVAYEVNDQTGGLTKKFSTNLPGNPGPLTFSPDASFVYASVSGLKGDKAGVTTLKRAADGSLSLLATATITSRSPHICTDKQGRFLLAAHYSAGDVTVYRIVDGICTEELLDRRKTAHTAHCIGIDPSGRFIFVPHIKTNNVFQFRLDAETGKLTPNDPPYADGPDKDHKYHAPRHYVHHPKLNVAYTSNETGGGITAWNFNPRTGTLSRFQTLSTLPPDFDGTSFAADIQMTPNGRFAYVSNRDVTERKEGQATEDTLAGVSLDPETGRMKLIGHFPTAHIPRTFCIDLTGRFVYSAGQLSATLFVYRIDQQTGKLDHFATEKTGGTPIWVMCGNVEK